MSLIVRDTADNNFEPAPEGQHLGVCCDVIDMGIVSTRWGDKHKIKILWQLESATEKGVRYIVQKLYTLSLAETANLRKDLERWRGKPFTEEETHSGFDLEKLIGVNAQITVVQNRKNDRIYANVDLVTPPPKGRWKALNVTDYTRKKEQQQQRETPETKQPPQRSRRTKKEQANDVALKMFSGPQQSEHKGGEFGSEEDDQLPF